MFDAISSLTSRFVVIRVTSGTVQRRSQISFNELVIEREIRNEGCAKVYLGKWNEAPVALKFYQRKGTDSDFMTELRIML